MTFDAFSVPSSDLVEPGEDQRWSTWPDTSPTERGPLPHPDWLVTEAAALDTELGVVKTGKEAELHLIERAVPGNPTRSCLLAAKRYRASAHRDFTRSTLYVEGRRTRSQRDERALGKKSLYGRELAATNWAFAEFEALRRLTEAGAPVPYPVQIHDDEILMQFIGDGITAAPRLAQSRARANDLAPLYDQVTDAMRVFVRSGFAHGDLSPYNILVHDGRIVVIDVPQIVDLAANPSGLDLLHRDCVNVATWFTRRGLAVDAESLFAELIAEVY
ncbi:serine protein kinase RIO [Paramicrobacterium agarici]|uniref:non-specific serine/threonine protein kinase n=1 Tax=Paramicrobacterium agarici TaxID=630514 RepID=A0A2A9DV90_9MICO|nr:RIO1 family regulatory kinase/ATPase [Microbacterium agarici]PFG30261.1 RIO kinase 1 [Microbacterium agarici]TQO23268.1 RIO kinase 1 [Microbacterium agarici]